VLGDAVGGRARDMRDRPGMIEARDPDQKSEHGSIFKGASAPFRRVLRRVKVRSLRSLSTMTRRIGAA
jgi:hypothetical protein